MAKTKLDNETGFKLGDVVPQLKELYEQLMQEQSLENKAKKFENYLLLLHEDSPQFPMLHVNNLNFKTTKKYLYAKTLKEKESYFYILSTCKNINIEINLDAINTSKIFMNATKITFYFTKNNKNIVYITDCTNHTLIRKAMKILNLRMKYAIIDEEYVKELNKNLECKIEFLSKYELV